MVIIYSSNLLFSVKFGKYMMKRGDCNSYTRLFFEIFIPLIFCAIQGVIKVRISIYIYIYMYIIDRTIKLRIQSYKPRSYCLCLFYSVWRFYISFTKISYLDQILIAPK